MEHLQKTYTTDEAIKLAEEHKWLGKLLSFFPNQLGINLCAVEYITIECEDDEYGQLTDLHIGFIPTHDKLDYESIKVNGGPSPWLVRNEKNEIVLTDD